MDKSYIMGGTLTFDFWNWDKKFKNYLYVYHISEQLKYLNIIYDFMNW